MTKPKAKPAATKDKAAKLKTVTTAKFAPSPVQSTNIVAVGHDGKDLLVVFKNGASWIYHKVSAEIHTALMTAESIGSYFSSEIKGKFKETEVKLDVPVEGIKYDTNSQQLSPNSGDDANGGNTPNPETAQPAGQSGQGDQGKEMKEFTGVGYDVPKLDALKDKLGAQKVFALSTEKDGDEPELLFVSEKDGQVASGKLDDLYAQYFPAAPKAEVKDGAFIPPEPQTGIRIKAKFTAAPKPDESKNENIEALRGKLAKHDIDLRYEKAEDKQGNEHWNITAIVEKGERTIQHSAKLAVDFAENEADEIYEEIVTAFVKAV